MCWCVLYIGSLFQRQLPALYCGSLPVSKSYFISNLFRNPKNPTKWYRSRLHWYQASAIRTVVTVDCSDCAPADRTERKAEWDRASVVAGLQYIGTKKKAV